MWSFLFIKALIQQLRDLKKKRKKAQISRDFADGTEKKKLPDEVCIDCSRGAFSILITHAGRPEEMEGVTSLAAHCSYFAALCASLTFRCSNTYLRAVLQ